VDLRALRVFNALALLAAALVGAAAAGGTDPFEAMAALRVRPPAAAPDVVFHSLDGRDVRLRELHGRPVLLGFFTTW
jgi:cytochrome oxidase Cu insertion factor (SCO1/SenC/PrrC family)